EIDEVLAAELSAKQNYETELAHERAQANPNATNISILEGQIAAREARIAALRGDKQNVGLREPWKDLNLRWGINYAGFSLGTSAVYNLYAKTATAAGASLTLPS